MPLTESYLVVKAFATFFELTNLAEPTTASAGNGLTT